MCLVYAFVYRVRTYGQSFVRVRLPCLRETAGCRFVARFKNDAGKLLFRVIFFSVRRSVEHMKDANAHAHKSTPPKISPGVTHKRSGTAVSSRNRPFVLHEVEGNETNFRKHTENIRSSSALFPLQRDQ